MYQLKFSIKYLMVFGLGIAGVLSLGRGFGLPIPFLEYGSLEAWNVIAGAGLLAFSLCLAFFWHLPRPNRPAQPQGFNLNMHDEWLLQASTTGPHSFKHRGR